MKNNSYKKGHDFEKDVLRILSHTGPYKITHHDGGSDRGRDIIVSYLIDGIIYDVIVQCKYYMRSVKIEDISSSLDWAKVHRPALFYIWVYPYLTSATKDYLDMFSKEYGIEIDYEERNNIEIYLDEIKKTTSTILERLKERIFSKITNSAKMKLPKYTDEECYLVDREETRKELIDNVYYSFFLQGISCCGKTQILKNVAYYYNNLGKHIFWFCFHESSSEIQQKSFWTNLSMFFETEYNDYTLQKYFKTYGYHITSILLDKSQDILKKYMPIIVIDDIHKCASDNLELKDFFYTIIDKEIITIFFAGWFNVFELTPIIQKKLKNIAIDGLESKYINEIIKHNTGKDNPDIAKKIVKDYNGLPGFAVIVDNNTVLEDFESDKSFLYSIIKYLGSKEQEILFVFVHATTPLPEKPFYDLGYYKEFSLLKSRKLIIKQNRNYIIHDKYRSILESYPLDTQMANSIINIFLKCSCIDAHFLLDIIMLYYKLEQYENAINFLNTHFKILLHTQSAKELLKYYQWIEEKLPLHIEKGQIMMNKAILLENCEEYELCKFYINILKNSIKEQDEEWEELFYLELRCFYFLNEYDELLVKVNLYSDKLLTLSKIILIQTFLLVGRVYYIRGFFNEAIFFYLIAFFEALKNNDKILITKSIHRIAMVEMKKGLITECYDTFRILVNLDEVVTIKRKSYIYYRMAECEYKLEHYKEAIENNETSFQLKQSIDHARGMIFCHRLSAKIALKSKDYMKANCEIQVALDISRKMGFHKEEISCVILQLKIYKKMHIELPDTLCNTMKQYLLIAQKERNVYRLHQIGNSMKDINEEIYIESVRASNAITSKIKGEFMQSFNIWKKVFTKEEEKIYYEITLNNHAVSKKLLILSGLYSTLEDY